VPSAGAAAEHRQRESRVSRRAAGVLSVVAGGAAAVSGLAASCFAQASASARNECARASLVSSIVPQREARVV